MKRLLFFICSTCIVLSCSELEKENENEINDTPQSQQEDSVVIQDSVETVEMLQITALLEDNPTRIQFESLLNSFYEPFEAMEFEATELQSTELVYGFSQFRTTESQTTVQFFFADHQEDLIQFGELNFIEGLYGVNGGGLFYVTGEDEQAVNDVLSWFSGAE